MSELQLLDNPMWNALTTLHRPYAMGEGAARAYLPAIGPLAGVAEETAHAYEDLRTLVAPDAVQALFLREPPEVHPGWAWVRGGSIDQMVFAGTAANEFDTVDGMRRLTAADVPAMVELATLTEPGPFRDRTHELGAFFGVFAGERLLAMAGQRMRVPGYVEVSAVCTHPEARGRGYARKLMTAVMKLIIAEGATPFLHAFSDNHGAIRVYEALGYRKRRTFHLAVVKKVA